MDSTAGMLALALLGPLLAVVVAVRQRRPKETLPPVLLGLELARIAGLVRQVEEGCQPSKAERLAAITLAYDLALRDYCRSVELPGARGARHVDPPPTLRDGVGAHHPRPRLVTTWCHNGR